MSKCKGEGEGKECVINGSRDMGKYLGKLREAPFLITVSTAVSSTVQMLVGIRIADDNVSNLPYEKLQDIMPVMMRSSLIAR